MSDCKKAKKLIGGYIDGVLKESDNAFFKNHIASCKECKEEYEVLKKVLSDTADLSAPLPEGFSRRLHTALVNEQFEEKKNAKTPFVFPYVKATSAVLACLVIAFVGKTGIYDTYKKVINDNQTEINRIAEENNEVNEVEPIEVNEVSENPPYVEPKQPDVPLVVNEIPAGEISPAFEQVQAPEEVTGPIARTIDEPTPLSIKDAEGYENTGEDVEPAIDENTGEDLQINEKSGENAPTVPEASLIPAQVKIYSGDGNMIMMKKFLLTFLSPEEIEESEDEIIITTQEAEFEKVVTKLSENEYVKEIIPGTAFEGIGKIYIR